MRIEQTHDKQYVKTLGNSEQQIVKRLYQEIVERRESGKLFQEQLNKNANNIRLIEERTNSIDKKIQGVLNVDFHDYLEKQGHMGEGGAVHALATEKIAGFMSAEDKAFINKAKGDKSLHSHANLSALDSLIKTGNESFLDVSLLSLAHSHYNEEILKRITASEPRGSYDVSHIHKHSNQDLLDKLVSSDNKAAYDLANLGQSHDHKNKETLDRVFQSGNEDSFDLSKINNIHSHNNKLLLDRLMQSGTELTFDLSKLSDTHKHVNKSVLDKIIESVSLDSYDLSSLHAHQNKGSLDRLNISPNNLLEIDGVEQSMHAHNNKSILDKISASKNNAAYDLGNLHKHINAGALDRLDINNNNQLTIDGVVASGGGGSHEHENLDILERIIDTSGNSTFDVADLHRHANKSILDKIMQSGTEMSFDISALSKSHEHVNKSILDKIVQTGSEMSLDVSNLSKAHTHANKDALDVIKKTGNETQIDVSDITSSKTSITNIQQDITNNISPKIAGLETRMSSAETSLNLKEAKSNKGAPNGYASLGADGKVPSSQLPVNLKEIKVVSTLSERDGLTKYEGLRVHVTNAAGDSTVESGWAEYLYTGTQFVKTAEKDSIDVTLKWENIQNIPTASATENGIMSISSFTKLRDIEEGANKYIHPATHSMSMMVETETQKIMTKAERDKLANIASNANNYTHPSTHPATMISITDSANEFTSTNVEGALLEAKQAGLNAVPSGMIMLWQKSKAIPVGWVLCDGNNGTMDLRSQYVSGSTTPTNDNTAVYIMKK